jgi:hypothetical protein
MREKLNNNPLLQVAVLGVLLLGTGFFVLSSMGGGEEEAEPAETEATVSVAGTGATGTATGSTPGEAVEAAIGAATQSSATAVPPPPGALAAAAPPPPREVTAAFESNRTVVLLFVRSSGIDDKLVKGALGALVSLPNVSTFVVPARRIARYAAITQGVEVNRVPALVVVRPKRLGKGIPTASVQYGFQSPQSIVQSVIDAGYKGRTLGYHP